MFVSPPTSITKTNDSNFSSAWIGHVVNIASNFSSLSGLILFCGLYVMEYNEGVDGRRLREDGLIIALDVEVCVRMFFLLLN